MDAIDTPLGEGTLSDRELLAGTNYGKPIRILPDLNVIKFGGQSLMDRGRSAVFPLIDEIAEAARRHQIFIGAGGGTRARHAYSLGLELGLPTGVLAAIGDVTRFSSSEKLVSYFGLNPKVRQSGDHPAYHGRISKEGRAHARALLVEAAWSIARQPGPLRAFLPEGKGKTRPTNCRRRDCTQAGGSDLAPAYPRPTAEAHALDRAGVHRRDDVCRLRDRVADLRRGAAGRAGGVLGRLSRSRRGVDQESTRRRGRPR